MLDKSRYTHRNSPSTLSFTFILFSSAFQNPFPESLSFIYWISGKHIVWLRCNYERIWTNNVFNLNIAKLYIIFRQTLNWWYEFAFYFALCMSLCVYVWMCLCSFLGVVYVMLFVCTIFFPYFLSYKIFISLQMFSSISAPFFIPFLFLSRFLSFRWNHFSVYLLKSAFFLLFLLYLMWVQGNILNNKQQIY